MKKIFILVMSSLSMALGAAAKAAPVEIGQTGIFPACQRPIEQVIEVKNQVFHRIILQRQGDAEKNGLLFLSLVMVQFADGVETLLTTNGGGLSEGFFVENKPMTQVILRGSSACYSPGAPAFSIMVYGE